MKWFLLRILLALYIIGEVMARTNRFSLFNRREHKSKRFGSKFRRRWSNAFDPELSMSPTEIIHHRGYPVEIHEVTTEDGYILELHRMPPKKPNAQPLFFQHGLLASSGRWVKNPLNISLVYQLHDLGYDIWLGNLRGNPFARKHVTLDVNDFAFWDFTWHEYGKDVTASLNYVLDVTQHRKLVYTCISFGCTAFFISVITQPSMNDKVDMMFALAPSTSVGYLRNNLINYVIVPFYEVIETTKRLQGVRKYIDFLTPGPVDSAVRFACRRKLINENFCQRMIARAGLLRAQVLEILPNVDRFFPTGTSQKTMTQFVQNIRQGQSFNAYDYGKEENYRRYGTLQPMSYDLGQVKVPVYIFWSQNDDYATERDIQWLAARLGNLKECNLVPDPYFGHFDFFVADKLNELINYPIISRLPPP